MIRPARPLLRMPARDNGSGAGTGRPRGAVIWTHSPRGERLNAIAEIACRLGDHHPDATFVVTGAAPGDAIPEPLVRAPLPGRGTTAARAFLDRWKPDAMIWRGGVAKMTMLSDSLLRVPFRILADVTSADIPEPRWPFLPDPARTTYSGFDAILTVDQEAATRLSRLVHRARRIEVTGPLSDATPALPCNEAERDALAAMIAPRPVWLAAGVSLTEEPQVIEAHRAAARLAHRLLLILVPADPARGETLAANLRDAGLTVAQRSQDEEPGAETSVYIADTEGEMGLWYRLASVCFIGGTLSPGGVPMRSPYEPAALGSAIIHGPRTGPHAAAFRRFTEEGAARRVDSARSLSAALNLLNSPDQAALMAQAAWNVSSEGAQVVDRITQLLTHGLGEPGL